MKTRKEKAVELFKKGYTCSQAVLGAYCDVFELDMDTAMKISCPFGGGMGRMRLVCGAFSGVLMVAGLYNGMTDASATGKKENYDLVNKLADEFKRRNKGTVNCTVGLKTDEEGNVITIPDMRNEEYYKKRPCIAVIEEAADIIDKMIMPLVDEKYESVNLVRVNTKGDITKAADMADNIMKKSYREIYSPTQIQSIIDKTQSCNMITSHIINNGCEYFLVTNGESVVGYCGYLPGKDSYKITALCIEEEYRAMGYGRGVVAAIATVAEKDDIGVITTACNVNLKDTIEIFKSWGFTENGTHEFPITSEFSVPICNFKLDL